MIMNNALQETLGWAGAVMLLAAFALTSYGIWAGTSMEYQLLNLVGSVLLAIYTYLKRAYPNTVLNVIWVVISMVAILRIFI